MTFVLTSVPDALRLFRLVESRNEMHSNIEELPKEVRLLFLMCKLMFMPILLVLLDAVAIGFDLRVFCHSRFKHRRNAMLLLS